MEKEEKKYQQENSLEAGKLSHDDLDEVSGGFDLDDFFELFKEKEKEHNEYRGSHTTSAIIIPRKDD